MPKVFVPNLGSHDHSDAERYGELVYVTKGHIEKYATGTMYRVWLKALKDSSPDDIILQTGLSTLGNVGAAVFGAMHGRLNLLLWRTDRYILREMVFTELMEDANV